MAAAAAVARSNSHGVALGPFASSLVVRVLVLLVDVGDLGDEGIVRVGIRQQWADREENLGDGERGRPLVLENIQADGPVAVDVHVVDFRREGDLGGLEGVVGWEVYVQEEHTLVVGAVLWAHNGSLPVELIILVSGASGAVRRGIPTEVDEFFLDSFKCHNIVLYIY